jgi:2-keto-3-deoxy-L-fuconate dehydrogenase
VAALARHPVPHPDAAPGGRADETPVPGGPGGQTPVPGGPGGQTLVPGGPGGQTLVPDRPGSETPVPGGPAGETPVRAGSARRPVHAVIADVTDDEAVRTAVGQAAAVLGGIDILVNNAGIGAIGSVEDNDDDEWRHVLDVNVLGMVRTTRAALPWLRRAAAARGQAAIVNTCSVAATAGLPQRALYSASKGAVYSLTLAVAADHARENIRVTCVNPGTTDTPWIARLLVQSPDPAAEWAALEARQPIGRMVSADEVAAAIAYLASPSAAATTGMPLAVDGGMSGLRLRPPGQAVR